MRQRHRHQWTEAGRVFSRPPGGMSVRHVSEELIERFALGVTSIELRCECGDVAERQLLGNHAP